MLPTPSTSHVDYDRVYEPAEDSYLLLDTLSSQPESQFLQQRFPIDAPSPLICEVGTGSGVVLAFATANASSILGRGDVFSLGIDLNHFACKATAQTVDLAIREQAAAEKNKSPLFLGATNTDLTLSLRDQTVDVLIFNPPYVPAPLPDRTLTWSEADTTTSHQKFERDSHLLALSYAGGEEGMEVTERLLAELPRVLTRRGVGYVLLCAQNRPEAVVKRICAWDGGWCAQVVGDSGKKAGWERLVVVRIWRPHSRD